MSNREIAKQLIDMIPEYKLPQIILFLQGAAIPHVEEVEPDEWDLQITSEADIENNGGTITI